MRLRNVWRILTLSCDGAARLLSDAEDRPLDWVERWALNSHLVICAWCRRYRDQLRLLDQLASQWPLNVNKPALTALSDAAKERIRARVVEEMGQRND